MYNPRDESQNFCTSYNMAAILHDCRFMGGMSASGQSAKFGGSVFGRDTLRVLRDLMPELEYKHFIEDMLCLLAQWQGTEFSPVTNELPGAIPHQVFREFAGGRRLPGGQIKETMYWARKWGVQASIHPEYGRYFIVYNSSDATALYLIALGEYCRLYGTSFLRNGKFRHYKDGATHRIAKATLGCVEYIVSAIERSQEAGFGLYAVPNTNLLQTSPSGVMRDGFDAYIHGDGQPVDYSNMAYIDNQGLAYEALLIAANELLPTHENTSRWRELAHELRTRTLAQFWMDERQFFAAALDSFGQVDMISSAVFELLNGPFFENHEDGVDYVRTIVRELYGANFMTPVGPRMRSLEHLHLEGNYWSYQGARTSWGNVTKLTVDGLFRWQLNHLACELAHSRFIPSLDHAGQAVEMLLVSESGIPFYHPKEIYPEAEYFAKNIAYPAELGQRHQAWVASAALGLLRVDCMANPPGRRSWQTVFERSMAGYVHAVPAANCVSPQPCYVDLVKGRRRKVDMARRLGYSA